MASGLVADGFKLLYGGSFLCYSKSDSFGINVKGGIGMLMRISAFLVFITLVSATHWSSWLPLSSALLSASAISVSVSIFGEWGLNRVSRLDWSTAAAFGLTGVALAILVAGRIPSGLQSVSLMIGGLAGSFSASFVGQMFLYYHRRP